MARLCSFRKRDGENCQSAPIRDELLCFWHHPDHAEEAAEARRLGGLRRKRERTVAGAYEFDGLGTVEQIKRLLEVAAIDTLALENGVARNRTLAYLAQTATKLLETGEFDERLTAVESALGPRLVKVKRR